MPADDELLVRALVFSGTYVSDNGNAIIRRVADGATQYSGSRFLGICTTCSRARALSSAGEALADVAAVIRFLSTHSHGDVD